MKFLRSFKLFEEFEDDLVVVATNECYWSWEYDAQYRTAKILLNEKTNDLYLHIKSVHIKSGIGAGQFPKELAYEYVGKLSKPDLQKIQTLLTENNYSHEVRFKRQWTDINGNQMALSQILKLHNNRFNKIVNLNKVSKERERDEQSNEIRIAPYKGGAWYVIYGPGTFAIKDEIKNNLYGLFNKFLDKPNGGKFAGWLIRPGMLDAAKKLIGKEVEETISESLVSPGETFELKNDILSSFSFSELEKVFPKIYDKVYDVIIEDSDLDYLKSENPDDLKFDFAEASQVYVWDYNEDSIEINFLKSWLIHNEFKISPMIKGYEELEENGKIIYETLEKEYEDIFWNLLSNNL